MGIRVIKTAVAASAAIYIAKFFGLHFYYSAGLIAILGVDVTIKRSIQSASQRLFASVLGLFFASLIFIVFGFREWFIALFILLTYPVLSRANLKDGIITSTVVVLHIFSLKMVSLSGILNEIWLLLIGLGSATFFNFVYMPKADRHLLVSRMKVESLFSAIFIHIAEHLKDNRTVWNGSELIDAYEAVEEGIALARKTSENELFRAKENWQSYFEMRGQQLDSIARMIDIVAQVYETLPHGQVAARLFEDLSKDVTVEYYTGNVESKLLDMEQSFKQMPLPATREEFEIRSAILQLCLELKYYLSIAKREKKRKQEIYRL